MGHLAETRNGDLRHVLGDMRSARESLLSIVTPLKREDFGFARRGGWTIERVLQHVIESEQMYAKLLAHQCGKKAADAGDAHATDGGEVEARLAETRANVLSMIDGIDDETLYRLVRIGHEDIAR